MPYPSQPGFYPDAAISFPDFVPTDDQPTPPAPTPPDTSPPDPPGAADPAELPEWTFVIGPASGGLARTLRSARSRKCSFKLDGPSDASCEVNGRHPDADHITELATDLHVFRATRKGARKQRLYRGRIGKSGDSFDTDKHTVTVPSLDYRAVLDRRALMSGSQVTWTDADLAAIAQGLIDQAQRLPGGSYGIGLGRVSAVGTAATYTFKLGESIAANITKLAERDDGFDWDITPTSASGLQLDVWAPQRGADKQVVLAFPGNVRSGSRTVDSSTYSNHVRLNGTPPEGSQTEPAIQERAAADIAARPEGRWDKTYGTQLHDTPGLESRADWQLADAEQIQPSYQLEMRSGFWRGPDHLWLGDTVLVRVKSGRLRVNALLRVKQLDVDIADDGAEKVTVTVGAGRPDYRQVRADTERRLADLERS